MENGKLPAFANKPYPEFGDDVRNGFAAWQGVNPTGLTKREYFAGLAMQGLYTAMHSDRTMHLAACSDAKEQQGTGTPNMERYCAGYAVRMADELLKALEQ